MRNADLRGLLTNAMIGTICSAARKLTGFARRQFQAEVAIQYCEGSARKTERIFGWGRKAVITGLCEKRTGLRCADAFRLRGRKKSNVAAPQLAAEMAGNEDSGTQAVSALQAVVASIGNSDAGAGARLMGVNPAPTDDTGRQSNGLILNRVGNRMLRALRTRRKKV